MEQIIIIIKRTPISGLIEISALLIKERPIQNIRNTIIDDVNVNIMSSSKCCRYISAFFAPKAILIPNSFFDSLKNNIVDIQYCINQYNK